MPSAIVKEMEVTGVPCLVVISTRPLAENEEITLDLGYQLEVSNKHAEVKLCGLLGYHMEWHHQGKIKSAYNVGIPTFKY